MNNLGNFSLFGVFGKNLSAFNRVRLDDLVFLGGQLSGLEENRVGDRDLPQVVQNPPDSDRVAFLLGQSQQAGHALAELADSLRMAECLAVPLVHHAALHDVGVAEPGVQTTLFLDTGSIDQKRHEEQEHDQLINKCRRSQQMTDQDAGKGKRDVGEAITSVGCPYCRDERLPFVKGEEYPDQNCVQPQHQGERGAIAPGREAGFPDQERGQSRGEDVHSAVHEESSPADLPSRNPRVDRPDRRDRHNRPRRKRYGDRPEEGRQRHRQGAAATGWDGRKSGEQAQDYENHGRRELVGIGIGPWAFLLNRQPPESQTDGSESPGVTRCQRTARHQENPQYVKG